MKKLFYVLFAFIALTVTAQAQETNKSKLTQYVSASMSLIPSDRTEGQTLANTSYASVEYGVFYKDVMYGLSIGRGQLSGTVASNIANKNFNNYFWEVRVQPTFPLGSITGNLIIGAGSYFGTSGAGFVEYGLGASKSYGDLSYGLSYSNWDGINYVTPSVSYSF